jgi:pyruvate/2-oxoglutarate dehydrogenase complex dihydrolipoamide acyltransferase (E2) component
MTRSPSFYLKNVGTCGLTFVEGDWYERIFPIAPTSVVFGIGGARREPVVVHDRIEIRRVLKCSLMVDNYVVPGPTAARLAKEFKSLLEEPSFLRDEISAAPGAEPGPPKDADAGWNRA